MLIYFHPSFTIYNLHYEKFQDGTVKCIEDEIPFEVPEGWEWCNLGALTDVYGRIGFRGYTKNDLVEKGKGAITLSPSNIIDNKMDYSSCTYISWEKYEESPEIMIQNNDILLVKTGSSYGKSAFVENLPEKATINPQFVVLKGTRINPQFLCYFLQSNYAKVEFDKLVVGTAIPTFSQANLNAMYIAFPGFNEQEKIVNKISELLKYVDVVNDEKECLYSAILQTKSKILDLAIRGKLVSQDSKNEPASVLLERIRAEKEELIKQGKIKRDKKESFIFRGDDNSYYETINENTVCIDDELPFELPEGWTWTRLQNISSILTDGTHKTPQYCDNGYVFLSSKNVTTGKIDWENIMYIPESLHEELYNRLSPTKGDILLAKNGTTGVAAIVDRDIIFDIYVSLALIRIAGGFIDSQYILNVISSSWVQEYFNKSLKGIGVPNLHLEHIRRTLIPISPYAEQQKIIRITNKVFQILNEISRILS